MIDDLFPLLKQKNTHYPDPFAFNLQIGVIVSQAISTVVQLGIADQLGDAPKTVAQLAQATHAHAPSLLILLRALTGIDVFAEVDEETFIHTDRSHLLCTRTPNSQADVVGLWGADYQWASWGHLSYTIRTGKPAIETFYEKGATIWTHLNANPQDREIFERATQAQMRLLLPALFDAYDFSRSLHMVDVGGGTGILTTSLLERYSMLHATLFDRPAIIEQVQRQAALDLPPEVICRYMQVKGDFFEQIPPGGDLYVFKDVLMEWGDENCREILENCHRAMHLAGRLLIIEPVLSDETPFSGFRSLQMALMSVSHQRHLEEHQRLLADSGFTLLQAIPLGLEYLLLEAQPDA